MAQPYIGEIRMFGGNFAIRGWSTCDGQLLAISSHSALFSILGTIYGGDGRTTFALPDLRGRVPMHQGNGPGLSDRRIGQKSGQEYHTLIQSEIPNHTHQASSQVQHNLTLKTSAEGEEQSPDGQLPAPLAGDSFGPAGANTMAAGGVTGAIEVTTTNFPTGGGQSHYNMQPYLVVTYLIALVGIFPSRN